MLADCTVCERASCILFGFVGYFMIVVQDVQGEVLGYGEERRGGGGGGGIFINKTTKLNVLILLYHPS